MIEKLNKLREEGVLTEMFKAGLLPPNTLRDIDIYNDKEFKHLSTVALSKRTGLSPRTIRRIISRFSQ